jgi:hypothetical protein
MQVLLQLLVLALELALEQVFCSTMTRAFTVMTETAI